jgi:pyridoxine kinase
MRSPYILAISSYAVHGTASLKTFTAVLGEKILPVPSIMLNGLTNMSLVRKFDTPFKELLQSTFELAVDRKLEVILYIGYLGKAEQADIILEMIGTYSANIKSIIIDPVCGDHGRKYVPDEVIAQWPKLIKKADMVFPNMTEIRILTGHQPDEEREPVYYIEKFVELFPDSQVVITSVKTGDQIGIEAYGNETYSYSQPVLPKNYGGSGDAFLALFLLDYFYKKADFCDSLKMAVMQTCLIIKSSIEKRADDLILEIPNAINSIFNKS